MLFPEPDSPTTPRISPFRSYGGKPSGAHGKNEHTSIQGFLEAQTFLRRVILMENSREA